MATCWNCNKEYPEGASACPHCRVPVTKAALDAMATIGPGGAPSVQIVPGSVVSGRYEVRREMGRGGMGIVYLAFDRTLEQEVALKVIPQELCMDPRAIADLKRETGIALKLTHPNIMRLHTLDTWEGQAFVVMEYIGGGTLAHLMAEKGVFTLEEALPVLEQIAIALDYSHSTTPAVIHRDLKPLNILLTEKQEVKVADFGLARVLRDSASRVSGSDSAGTLAYMAPEQIRGKGIGSHTDIYAFAAITYEMLAGHPPYHTGDLRWQIMHEEPDLIVDQPECINEILLSSLSQEVQARPLSAGELVRQLNNAEIGAILRESESIQQLPRYVNQAPSQRPATKGDVRSAAPEEKLKRKTPQSPFGRRKLYDFGHLYTIAWFLFIAFILGTVIMNHRKIDKTTFAPNNASTTRQVELVDYTNGLRAVNTKGRLTVSATPSDAKVRILNIVPRYIPGMELEAGRYHVEVSKAGYRKVTHWVKVVGGEEQDVAISLKRQLK